ncbi:MAG: hypothetical protein D6814_09630, partial [Calditrichaeota bacterium]
MKKLLLLCVFVTTTVSLSFAQNAPISLSKCIDLALKNSYRLQQKQSEQEAVHAAFETERSQYFPQIFADGSHNQLFFSHYNYRQQVAQLALDWRLGDGLLKTADVQKQHLRAVEAQKEQVSLQLMREISFLYINILQKQLNDSLLQNRLQVLNQHLQVAQALWQAGTRTQFDVL